eukprot:CAMPEP_0197864332 /NCGR_PEP_ID=MMETSP1438-20131217/42511_1 /TAXON_ID=1461541 /ORGANISM="Pterosperma sp., Strain CCMP1384" /LENGTH=162 /DNA_ID=CAMNT_0043482549 /DNA_START=15 /DNA_END=503 /DNA_ORIENTATION=+
MQPQFQGGKPRPTSAHPSSTQIVAHPSTKQSGVGVGVGMYGMDLEEREKVLEELLSKEKVLQVLYTKTFPADLDVHPTQNPIATRPLSATQPGGQSGRGGKNENKDSNRMRPSSGSSSKQSSAQGKGRDWAMDVDEMLAQFMGVPQPKSEVKGRNQAGKGNN